jgi:AmiR/NasT family two-component response regulator
MATLVRLTGPTDVCVVASAGPTGWTSGQVVSVSEAAVIHEQPELRPAFVVLVSYARDRSLLHRVSRFKVDDYQVKPLSAARLANRLSRLLGSQQVPAILETATA